MTTEPVICPWCGGGDVERRGPHWCCVNPICQAFWLAYNVEDKKLLRRLRIALS